MDKSRKSVGVVGAGIVGVCTALMLQRRGFKVTIIDSNPPGEGASFGNAGCFNASSIVPMSMPGMVTSVPKWLLDPMGPLAIRFSYLPTITPWLIQFLRAGRPGKVKEQAKALRSLLKSTVPLITSLAEEAGAAHLIRHEGHLTVYRSESEFAKDRGGWELLRLNRVKTRALDAAAQTAAVAAGTLNPYNPGAASPALLDQILFPTTKYLRQTLGDVRAILEGTLFDLPGGGVRVALGAEYTTETVRTINRDRGVATINASADRSVRSVFGELVVPIVSSENGSRFMQELTFSASGRYDDYSDFGDTFNPKLGLTWRPGDWLRVRGNWGKSFNAPSLVDRNAPDTRAIVFPFNPLLLTPGTTVVLAGGDPNLRPQKADIWSVGADLTPVEGLQLSATYYNIRLRDQITFPTVALLFSPAYANVINYANPSSTLVQQAIGDMRVEGFPALLAGPVSTMLDLRRRNLGFVKQDGIDFNASYRTDTGFGSIEASAGGTYTLNRDVKVTPVAAFQDYLTTPGQSRFLLQASLGATVGGLTGRVTFNHREGYDLNPAVGGAASRFPLQTKVDSFNTVDLFLDYDVKGEGLFKDLSFTLNVNNLLDQDPPFYNDPSPIFDAAGYTNGSTYGRYVQFGVRKKF